MVNMSSLSEKDRKNMCEVFIYYIFYKIVKIGICFVEWGWGVFVLEIDG